MHLLHNIVIQWLFNENQWLHLSTVFKVKKHDYSLCLLISIVEIYYPIVTSVLSDRKAKRKMWKQEVHKTKQTTTKTQGNTFLGYGCLVSFLPVLYLGFSYFSPGNARWFLLLTEWKRKWACVVQSLFLTTFQELACVQRKGILKLWKCRKYYRGKLWDCGV